jgi:hypothetical protein
MAPEKFFLQNDQRKIMIIAWICNSVEFFVTCLPGHTQDDIDACTEHAVDAYLNRSETPGSAIPMGVALARRRIKQRHIALTSRVIAVNFLAKRRIARG